MQSALIGNIMHIRFVGEKKNPLPQLLFTNFNL